MANGKYIDVSNIFVFVEVPSVGNVRFTLMSTKMQNALI